jgi:hypothetical protein
MANSYEEECRHVEDYSSKTSKESPVKNSSKYCEIFS